MNLLQLIEDLRRDHDTPRAQEELYGILCRHLLEPLRSRINGKLRARLDAEDVLHDAFLRAMAGLPSVEFASGKAFLAWVWRIARNLITDQAKRLSAGILPFGQNAGASILRESKVLSRERKVESVVAHRDWIESILSRLKEREAEVIRLRWLEGLTYEKIAAKWKKTPVAVKRFYCRAWTHFREIAIRETSSALVAMPDVPVEGTPEDASGP